MFCCMVHACSVHAWSLVSLADHTVGLYAGRDPEEVIWDQDYYEDILDNANNVRAWLVMEFCSSILFCSHWDVLCVC